MTLVTGDPAVAAGLLEGGALVAFPTETVYGLGADAGSDAAVARLFEAKGRPSFNPLIIHVASIAAAAEHGAFDTTARTLAEAFWPGPLTLVVPRRPRSAISRLATAGLDSIGLRLPAHPLAQELLTLVGRPLAAPSAILRLNAVAAEPGEVLVTFGALAGAEGDEAVALSEGGDLFEAAANLFRILHDLDHRKVARIAIMPIPETGLGLAINDRLRRAAARPPH
jgi:tRNA threonylcarbamoyl adenosine modification protein (Sua5/YciO/YrdC/YwlC family)